MNEETIQQKIVQGINECSFLFSELEIEKKKLQRPDARTVEDTALTHAHYLLDVIRALVEDGKTTEAVFLSGMVFGVLLSDGILSYETICKHMGIDTY